MKIMKKLTEKAQDIHNNPIPTIAFIGDSVTQGCFDVYMKTETQLETTYDKNAAYHNYLAQMLTVLYPSVPVNIINAGISGGRAEGAAKRLERDVLRYQPDLTVVSFGLNDSGAGAEGIPAYQAALKSMFLQLQQAGSEVVFMTENMMCTSVSCHLHHEVLRTVAANCMERQNNGLLDQYFAAARETAAECGVKVCDVYAKWKKLAECGVDTTALLSNHINHPTKEMNRLFAYSLIETMME